MHMNHNYQSQSITINQRQDLKWDNLEDIKYFTTGGSSKLYTTKRQIQRSQKFIRNQEFLVNHGTYLQLTHNSHHITNKQTNAYHIPMKHILKKSMDGAM